ncbi:MAG: stage III sporulation protein AB [Ruminococcus sp.]|nr:stage III sporulation protein AB [Ruminococcus sp.]MCM1479861.1 stage III sporulation protein AB [Muribaculaceae bacterium]
MKMLKFAGIILIISVTSFAGFYFSSALKKRETMLKKLNFMLEEILILLRYKSATVYEIAETLASDERFSEFEFLGNVKPGGKTFRESWCGAVYGSTLSGMKKSDIELIADIGKKLGTSDLEGQISTVLLQRSELETLIAAAEEECSKKAKLYRSLGALSGAFIAVMLI